MLMRIFDIDIFSSADDGMIRACARVLEGVPDSRVKVRHRSAGAREHRDAVLKVEDSGFRTLYTVECKRHLAPVLESTVRQVRDYADRHESRPMVMAPYVNDAIGLRLRAEKIDYVDSAGNAFISAPPLAVFFRGHKLKEQETRSGRLFHGVSGLRLLTLLLTTQKSLGWGYRELAEGAGISLGSASQLMGELRREGYLRSGADHLSNPADLLGNWVQGYRLRLRRRLLQRTYRQAEGRGLQDLVPILSTRKDIWVGGELAASLTTGLLRPQRATLHVPPGFEPGELIRALRLLPDVGGNIDVMSRFGKGEEWVRSDATGVQIIAPLMVYAELVESPDDRLRETARVVYETEIATNVPGLADAG